MCQPSEGNTAYDLSGCAGPIVGRADHQDIGARQDTQQRTVLIVFGQDGTVTDHRTHIMFAWTIGGQIDAK